MSAVKPETRRYATLEECSRATAAFIAGLIVQGVAKRGFFTLVLAGGSTPRLLYENLAGPSLTNRIPWEGVHLFWGDERCVGPDQPQSNFGMASHTLLAKIDIPPENIHRLQADLATPQAGAAAYEKTIRDFFRATGKTAIAQDAAPVFDCVLLGMGPDGHTASLFPEAEALGENDRWVTAVPAPKAIPAVARITLTLPVINKARNVIFLVSGLHKEKIVQTILESPQEAARRFPAALVKPENGRLIWCIAAE